MPETKFIATLIILFAAWVIYLWFIRRKWARDNRTTLDQYLWELRKITAKSEYEIFHIAAEEKGWPEGQVENDFRRFLEDQTLPIYVKEFLEEGKGHIDEYRSRSGIFFDKRLILFHLILGAVLIGGAFILTLYVFPRIYQFDYLPGFAIRAAIKANPRLAPPFIKRAISFGEKGQIEKACTDLKLACDLGYCEVYRTKKKRVSACKKSYSNPMVSINLSLGRIETHKPYGPHISVSRI